MRWHFSKTSGHTVKRRGFTLVELLIVIVVIAILAAITIIAYNGVTKKAVESSMQSDLRNSATAIEIDHQTNGDYPADAASVNGGQGLKASGSNVLSYTNTGAGYCVSVTSPKTATTYRIKSSDGQITSGDCLVHVTTLAGSTNGFADGTGSAALFNYPQGLSVDSSGNVYVADTDNNRIRKITPGGVVTTFAGSGTAGFADGTGTAAQFNQPEGVAIDSSGNIYVADTNNNRIRKITSDGVVTTFAGSGTAGGKNATGTAAWFYHPGDIAIDGSGNLYVADNANHEIRKITPSAVVTTFAGTFGTYGFADGTGTAAKFGYYDLGVAVDGSGNVYVGDNGNYRIRKITPDGNVTTLAGSGTAGFADGTGTAAQFGAPESLTVDSTGNIYVIDGTSTRIRKVSSSGVVTTFANTTNGSTDGILSSDTTSVAKFANLNRITIDASGNLYVSDSSRIRKITQ